MKKNKHYRVFTDFHHASLLQSFILLFEKRLGGQVYRPIGREWFDQGFWKVYDHPATVEQYLSIGGATPDGTAKLNEVLTTGEDFDGISTIYNCQDIDSGQTNKAITFDGFMSSHFDIVIASIPAHIEPFKRLCELHPDHPKFIFQIGNSWTVDAGLSPNIMASALIDNVPADIHFITYHQEFDLMLFHPRTNINGRWNKHNFDVMPENNVYSFINCFDSAGHFAQDWQLFTQVEAAMPDYKYKVYGGQCRDGSANGATEVAKKMREAMFIWHTKFGGDGYGHVIHNAPAVGKPLIVKKQYYSGKIAEPLLIDGETCLTIDGLDCTQVINKIRHFSNPDLYIPMSKAAYSKFREVVNFNVEADKLADFLLCLK